MSEVSLLRSGQAAAGSLYNNSKSNNEQVVDDQSTESCGLSTANCQLNIL